MNVIQKFEQEYVIKNDKIKFNIENIKPKPKNYDMKNELCNLQYWIHKFDRKYKTFTISKYDVEWLLKAHQLYQLNKKFSNIYEDEINDFIKYYTKLLQDDKNNENKYFVRAEGVSLKYGIHGIGPYTSTCTTACRSFMNRAWWPRSWQPGRSWPSATFCSFSPSKTRPTRGLQGRSLWQTSLL